MRLRPSFVGLVVCALIAGTALAAWAQPGRPPGGQAHPHMGMRRSGMSAEMLSTFLGRPLTPSETAAVNKADAEHEARMKPLIAQFRALDGQHKASVAKAVHLTYPALQARIQAFMKAHPRGPGPHTAPPR